MRKSLSLVAWLFIAAHASSATGTPQKVESDEAKFVRLMKQLERDPLQDSDKSIRTWLLEWAEKSQDVTVTVCDVLGPIPSQEVPYGPEILTQSIFGNAAFQILQPGKRNDLMATQLAGIRSSMRAYASIIEKHPDARIPYFDDLLSKDGAGTLDAFLAPVITEKCSSKDGPNN